MIDALLTLARACRAPACCAGDGRSGRAGQLLRSASCREHEPGRRVQVGCPGLRAPGRTLILRLALENLLANAWEVHRAPGNEPSLPLARCRADGRPVFLCVTTAWASTWRILWANCLVRSSAMRPMSFRARVSAWPTCSALWCSTAAASGGVCGPARGHAFHFTLRARPDWRAPPAAGQRSRAKGVSHWDVGPCRVVPALHPRQHIAIAVDDDGSQGACSRPADGADEGSAVPVNTGTSRARLPTR